MLKIVLFALVFPVVASSSVFAIGCGQEGGIHSLNGDTPATITFKANGENDETQFKIYWLNYDGKRVFYKHIFAGESYIQPTFMTHPWLITAPEPGGGETCVEIYLPDDPKRTITLQ